MPAWRPSASNRAFQVFPGEMNACAGIAGVANIVSGWTAPDIFFDPDGYWRGWVDRWWREYHSPLLALYDDPQEAKTEASLRPLDQRIAVLPATWRQTQVWYDESEATTPVSNTVDVSWEALQFLVPTSAVPWEAAGAVLGAESVNWEALQLLAPSNTVVWESLQHILQTVQTEWEALQGLFPTGVVFWEAGGTAIGTVVVPWEALQDLLQSQSVPWEALQGIQAIVVPHWESLQAIAPTVVVVWENLGRVVQVADVPWTALQHILSQNAVPWEALTVPGGPVQQDVSVPWEALGAVAAVVVVPWEAPGHGAPIRAFVVVKREPFGSRAIAVFIAQKARKLDVH